MKKVTICLILIILITLGITIFFLTRSKISNTSSPSITDQNGNKDIVQYAIEMDNYSFSPNFITAEPGKDLKIKISSKNGVHDLRIDKLNFDSGSILPGESKIFSIKISKDITGSYEFYCNIGNHKERGMIGKIQINNI